MTLFRTLPAAAAAAAMLAGGLPAMGQPTAPAPRAAASEPYTPEQVWMLRSPRGGTWSLFYAYAAGRYAGMRQITFSCRRGERRVHAALTVGEGDEIEGRAGTHRIIGFTLVGFVDPPADNISHTYEARAVLTDDGGVIRDAPIRLPDPVLTRFALNGDLSLNHNPIGAYYDRERAYIRSFFRYCAG